MSDFFLIDETAKKPNTQGGYPNQLSRCGIPFCSARNSCQRPERCASASSGVSPIAPQNYGGVYETAYATKGSQPVAASSAESYDVDGKGHETTFAPQAPPDMNGERSVKATEKTITEKMGEGVVGSTTLGPDASDDSLKMTGKVPTRVAIDTVPQEVTPPSLNTTEVRPPSPPEVVIGDADIRATIITTRTDTAGTTQELTPARQQTITRLVYTISITILIIILAYLIKVTMFNKTPASHLSSQLKKPGANQKQK